MAQGHALSVLTRAFKHTNNQQYLEAASKAFQLFKHPIYSEDNNAGDESTIDHRQQKGVSSKFMEQFLWFEEYPTHPNTFVLNGFMYSLIGLYDFWHAVTMNSAQGLIMDDIRSEGVAAGRLFLQGLKSLNAMLPFYDTGSGSVYDLRHVTMTGVEPKIARWDYHAVHINLLYLLSTINTEEVNTSLIESGQNPVEIETQESVLLGIAERWLSYMYGKRAQHN